jgi:signal transduction histidine kinase/ActR/RegA family two-component response regulator
MSRSRVHDLHLRVALLVLMTVLSAGALLLSASSESIFPRSVVLLCLTGILALSGGWFASDLVMLRRARGLVEAYQKMMMGDLSARSGPVYGNDEIGRLARAFDEMASAVQARDRQHEEAQKALRRSEEQFRHAQKLQAMGRLAGGVAHDFNNLLTVITGYGEILQESLPPDHPGRPHLEELLKASHRAASLTRQLLAFSRKQVMCARVLDLNAVVADMEKMLRRLIGEDIELILKREAALCRIKADPGQIEQILMNLAVNARDAMAGGGRLTIETGNADLDDTYVLEHPDARAGPHVFLSITDTGCGMDSETQAHLFEPFFTTKAVGQGTGLGLSTVYGIVRQSGGSIAITSTLGRGTSVRIHFPRIETPAGEEESSSPPQLPQVAQAETVLVVEDSDVLRKLVHGVLTAQGYQVLEAGDGREAVRVFERHAAPVNLLLTDVVMPKAGGRDLANYLRTLLPDLKILFMSGYLDTAFIQHGMLDGKVYFICKPFTPMQLARKVREVLDDPRGGASPRNPVQESEGSAGPSALRSTSDNRRTE